MASITTSRRFSGTGQMMFRCIVMVAAIIAFAAQSLAQFPTQPISEVRPSGTNSSASYADEGLGSFRHISSAPVPTQAPPPRLSLADVAPGLLPFFNNAPVFGLPGTVEGKFWHRTQLLGGLNGRRMDLANHGLF